MRVLQTPAQILNLFLLVHTFVIRVKFVILNLPYYFIKYTDITNIPKLIHVLNILSEEDKNITYTAYGNDNKHIQYIECIEYIIYNKYLKYIHYRQYICPINKSY